MTQNNYPFKVIKPPLTNSAMCVYKMSFSNGCYYIGGTYDLGGRITKHLLDLSKKKHSNAINSAFQGCNSVTFEFIEFINDRKSLNKREDFHLSANVGKKMCLNKHLKSRTKPINKGKVRVVKFDSKQDIVATYDSITEAALSIGRSYRTFVNSLNKGYRIKGMKFRALDENGHIVEPIKNTLPQSAFCKQILQYDLCMKLLNTFCSIAEAERLTKISRRSISTVAQNKQKATNGFIFRFSDA